MTRVKTNHRRRANWALRVWRAFAAPVLDKPSYDLSLTRLIAVTIMWENVHLLEPDHKLTWMHVVLFVIAAAIAFGKATFTFFLTRMQVGIAGVASTASVQTDVNETIREITERRVTPAEGGGFEPTS